MNSRGKIDKIVKKIQNEQNSANTFRSYKCLTKIIRKMFMKKKISIHDAISRNSYFVPFFFKN